MRLSSINRTAVVDASADILREPFFVGVCITYYLPGLSGLLNVTREVEKTLDICARSSTVRSDDDDRGDRSARVTQRGFHAETTIAILCVRYKGIYTV